MPISAHQRNDLPFKRCNASSKLPGNFLSFKGRIKRTINDAELQSNIYFSKGEGDHRDSEWGWEDLSGFLATSMPDWRGFAISGF